jgi:hypothetical protein
VGLLAECGFEQRTDGDWWVVFRRGVATPRIPRRNSAGREDRLPGPLAIQVERIVEAVGGDDRAWWTHCVRRLGAGPIDRALGQLAETRRAAVVRNPGGMLTKIMKDIAARPASCSIPRSPRATVREHQRELLADEAKQRP